MLGPLGHANIQDQTLPRPECQTEVTGQLCQPSSRTPWSQGPALPAGHTTGLASAWGGVWGRGKQSRGGHHEEMVTHTGGGRMAGLGQRLSPSVQAVLAGHHGTPQRRLADDSILLLTAPEAGSPHRGAHRCGQGPVPGSPPPRRAEGHRVLWVFYEGTNPMACSRPKGLTS